MLFDLFKYPNDRVKERMQRAFKNKAVATNELRNEPVTIDEAKRHLKKALKRALI